MPGFSVRLPAETPTAASMPPFEFLGPYRLGRQIGRGGMGTVYEAVHEKSGQRVAVKLISSAVADDMKFRRRFYREVETLKRLRHPNIVRLIGYGEEAGHLFYSMELVEGESLQQRIRRLKRIDWLPTLEIAIQVCAALKHAHDIGVIHRDLKPANLLLTDDGTVKLVDFGIAKLFGDGEQTAAGSVLGTADYMAPEQAGEGPITARTDLYALGSVMYAMLTGRAPFTGKRLTEVIDSLKRDRPLPLDLIDPELPEEIVSLVHDLLEKDPQDRPPTALAVLNRVKATREGLRRDQTVHMDRSRTVDSREFAPDPPANRSDDDDGTGFLADGATDEGGAATEVSSVGTGPSPRQASPDDVTVVAGRTQATGRDSHPEEAKEEGQEGQARPSRSHFQPVEERDSHASLFGTHDEHDRFHWAQALSIAGMVAILIAGIAVIAYALQTPSADQLYLRVTEAEASGDLLDAEPAIRRFLEDYPDDPRAEDLEVLAESIQRERFVRRLEAKANRVGGADQLSPMEQAFLQAMDARARQPAKAREQLGAWLDVYTPAEPLGRSAQRMAEIAKSQWERLGERSISRPNDPRVSQLLNRLDWAAENLDRDQRLAVLNGIERLFGEKPWARPVLQRVRSEREQLQGEQPPTAAESSAPEAETATPDTEAP